MPDTASEDRIDPDTPPKSWDSAFTDFEVAAGSSETDSDIYHRYRMRARHAIRAALAQARRAGAEEMKENAARILDRCAEDDDKYAPAGYAALARSIRALPTEEKT